jgi:uncharacterized protein YgiM (DUF1202 family)
MIDARVPGPGLKRTLWLCLLGMILLAPTPSATQTFKTVAGVQQLYDSPSFSGTVVGTVPEGAEVTVLTTSGEWYQVEYQGKQGWLPPRAFPEQKRLPLSSLLQGRAVQGSQTDEVALAGKGFTPEVEADFRRQHPNLRYDQVDQIEKFTVNAAALQAFRQEGGLR